MIELKDLNKSFRTAAGLVDAVHDVNLRIDDGDIFGIIGFSGAGKSTLVRCMNLLERPTSGQVIIDGTDLCGLGRKQLREARRGIGMIFQQFNLLSQRTVEANIRYPLEIAGTPKAEASKRAAELLEMVDLADKARAYPVQLSGGQKQRVAIARALASNPRIILCDEATSALDPITTASILDLLKRLNEQLGVTIVVITHEMKVVEQICDRVAVMSDGRIVEQGSVHDVFLRPTSDTAKRLIEPSQGALTIDNTPNTLRLAFTGEESGAPVISDMTVQCDVMVNILSANTENIGGKAFGQMLIQLPDDEAARQRIRAYLDSRGILYEESAAVPPAEPVQEEGPREVRAEREKLEDAAVREGSVL
ncbi:methionine ABC transporter ATP-binding protein [Adlercreutzia murintestinalis]|uniref:methionine ABC transporter ATP-binding protein n=1 Tax=Adlercreutzia murintestinalis TaxID=2941325 RepID=UPI00203F9939|nr:ATP-binding cassette domain-containing protein [Adlercreutzia murintestinalis]